MTKGTEPRRYAHVEAFCLMRYASDDRNTQELVWNSRDGVTPFVIQSKDGTTELTHIDWKQDQCLPDYRPQSGDRIFVDMTPERAHEHAVTQVKKEWDREPFPMRSRTDLWETPHEAVEYLAQRYLERSGQPDLITVTGRQP